MQLFSQRDPRWANKKMLPSNLMLGRYGCTTTDIAMLSTYFGDNLTPAQVCDQLKYTNDGLIIWASCTFPHFSFLARQQGRDDVVIKNALADPNMAVILQVANGSHWVVATGKQWFGRGYNIADPWFGDRSNTSRYGNITGSATFRRK